MGASAEDIEAWAAALDEQTDDGDGFEVMRENWHAVIAFCACSSQWQVNMDRFVGLRYEGVEAVLRMAGVRRVAPVFEKIRVMEAAALGVLNTKANGS